MPVAADLWRCRGGANLFQSWEGPGIIHHAVGRGAAPVAWRDGLGTGTGAPVLDPRGLAAPPNQGFDFCRSEGCKHFLPVETGGAASAPDHD